MKYIIKLILKILLIFRVKTHQQTTSCSYRSFAPPYSAALGSKEAADKEADKDNNWDIPGDPTLQPNGVKYYRSAKLMRNSLQICKAL